MVCLEGPYWLKQASRSLTMVVGYCACIALHTLASGAMSQLSVR